MSIGSFLFGKDEVRNMNTPDIESIANSLWANADPGLGMAGRLGKSMLKLISQGRFSELPEVGYVQARGARNWQDMKRQLEMSSNATGMDPRQVTGLLQKGMLQNQDQTGLNALGAVANASQYYGNMFNMARQQRMDDTYRNLMGSAQIKQSGLYQYHKPGAFQRIQEIGQALSPFASMIPGLGMAAGAAGAMGQAVSGRAATGAASAVRPF